MQDQRTCTKIAMRDKRVSFDVDFFLILEEICISALLMISWNSKSLILIFSSKMIVGLFGIVIVVRTSAESAFVHFKKCWISSVMCSCNCGFNSLLRTFQIWVLELPDGTCIGDWKDDSELRNGDSIFLAAMHSYDVN